MKVIIFDPIGGASGDMILGSLMHLGCPSEVLIQTWDALALVAGGTDKLIKTALKKVNGITAVDLKLDFASQNNTSHRAYKDIQDILTSSTIDEKIKNSALAIFDCIARAEAEVHDVKMDDVHFHEVGALDSIFDVVGIAAALNWFKPDMICSRQVPLGQGTTRSMHGTIPVPAPATIKILQGMQVRFTDIEGELTTPTGAAVLKALSSPVNIPSDVMVKGVGYGCGDRTYETWPNLFRSILAEVTDSTDQPVFMIETDIDDMSPENWEYVQEKLFESGALDVSLTARIMKRSRPGFGVKVLTNPQNLDTLMDVLLNQTSTIGVRYYPVQRIILPRKEYTVNTQYGEIRIKETITPDGTKRYKPEYQDLLKIAREAGKPIAELRKEIECIVRKE